MVAWVNGGTRLAEPFAVARPRAGCKTGETDGFRQRGMLLAALYGKRFSAGEAQGLTAALKKTAPPCSAP